MRIAMLADLHGNLPALEAVAAHIDAQRVDAVYCLGDLVGKGPRSAETMDWAFAHCDVIVKGNWDVFLSRMRKDSPANRWYARQLGRERQARLAALPLEHRFTLCGQRVRLLHGRPVIKTVLAVDDPFERRAALFRPADGYRPDIVGFADSHRPFYQVVTNTGILFNTGSVGNPLGGQVHASYLLLEGAPGDAAAPLAHTIVQVPYDREEAIRQARAADGLPMKEAYLRELETGRYSR